MIDRQERLDGWRRIVYYMCIWKYGFVNMSEWMIVGVE